MKISILGRTSAAVLTFFTLASCVIASKPVPQLQLLGTYATGSYDLAAAEIVAHDPVTQRLFVVNGATSKIDVLDVSNPTTLALLFSINLSAYGRQANSVDIYNGVVAAAVEAVVKTDNGKVVFFDTNGTFLNAVDCGALPDMVTFTPNGEKVLVANEAEPNNDYTIDPEGSVTIVDVSNGIAAATATTAGFGAFTAADLDPSVRIYGPGATIAEDIEPEYIAVSHDSKTAWVTLQENNAIGILDLASGQFTDIVGLGFKNHSLEGNGLDPSDRDSATNNGINIRTWPVKGMYEPDGIAAFKYKEEAFLITANEGDAREWTGVPGFIEEARINSLTLDPVIFPNFAILQNNANLGRLNVTRATGNVGGDVDYESLHPLGARSFSIWNAAGEQVFDSGDFIERLTADLYPNNFNASNTNNNKDDRSDNKGPEPEGVTIGKAYGRTYAFIGLERIGGVLVYDVSNPYEPVFVQYINNRNFTVPTNTAAAGDLGPEGLHFISDEDSPTGVPLLAVANEVSGTTSVYEFVPAE